VVKLERRNSWFVHCAVCGKGWNGLISLCNVGKCRFRAFLTNCWFDLVSCLFSLHFSHTLDAVWQVLRPGEFITPVPLWIYIGNPLQVIKISLLCRRKKSNTAFLFAKLVPLNVKLLNPQLDLKKWEFGKSAAVNAKMMHNFQIYT
jgi:hypothetical protein